mgnify:CR=1 FL=1
MKLHEPTQITINRNKYYIFPLPAFTAANLSGDILALLAPFIGGIAPAISTDGANAKVEDILLSLTAAFNSMEGDKLEALLRKILLDGKNITVETDDDPDGERLDQDLINELFCGNVQDMYILAFHVLKVNYQGFFKKLSSRFGGAFRTVAQKASKNTDISTAEHSQNSNSASIALSKQG